MLENDKIRSVRVMPDALDYHDTTETGDGWRFRDVLVSIDNGKIRVRADATAVSRVSIHWDAEFSGDEPVYGDWWERGHGDMMWRTVKSSIEMPWYFLVKKNDICECYGVKTGPDALCYWRVDEKTISLYLDLRCGGDGVTLNGNAIDAAEIVSARYACDSMTALSEFCSLMCGSPRLPSRPVYGGNDWYCNYGGSSYGAILDHTKIVTECAAGIENRPFMVIDAGWQQCFLKAYNGGPWMPNGKFGDMAALADDMKALGADPGIWYRPLLTLDHIKNACILWNESTDPIPGVILDPSREESLEYIANDIKRIRGWGYKMIKHDFTTYDMLRRWGHVMGSRITDDGWHFYDRTKTTAQVIKKLYETIRAAAGDDVMIIGCNSISHLSAGLFELNRTGGDTSGFDWNRTKVMGVNALAYRMHQHGKFYAADADCVGITDKIDWKKNAKWLDVLSKSGTPLFVSIATDSYNATTKKAITEAYSRASVNTKTSVPLDWETEMFPKKWQSAYGTDEYDWDD